MNKTVVKIVKERPAVAILAMQAGIQTKEAAQAWGEKLGVAVVYFIPSRERVYAQRTVIKVK